MICCVPVVQCCVPFAMTYSMAVCICCLFLFFVHVVLSLEFVGVLYLPYVKICELCFGLVALIFASHARPAATSRRPKLI